MSWQNLSPDTSNTRPPSQALPQNRQRHNRYPSSKSSGLTPNQSKPLPMLPTAPPCYQINGPPADRASAPPSQKQSQRFPIRVVNIQPRSGLHPRWQPSANSTAHHNDKHAKLNPAKFTESHVLPCSPGSAKLKATSAEQLPTRQRKTLHENTEGLGIHGVQSESQSPIPVSLDSPGATTVKEKNPSSSKNIAQRIEQRLFKYDTSQNIVVRWGLEIVSWVISFLCMIGIIIILAIFDNKEMPQLPLNIPLTSIISFLSRIASAALLIPATSGIGQLKWSWFRKSDSKRLWDFEIFDEASRGPWGSFLLLLRTKGRSLAAIGAVITVLALGLDPFFQQITTFPQRWVPLNPGEGNCSIPRVVNYSTGAVQEKLGAKLVLSLNDDIVNPARKFFYDNGTQPRVIGNGTVPAITLSCPTSRCTWPRYQTLGVCSSCTDIRPLLQFDCLNATNDWSNTIPGFSLTGYPKTPSCGYFINATGEDPTLMTGYSTNDDYTKQEEVLVTRIFSLTTPVMRNPLYGNGSLHYKEINSLITDIFIAGAPNGIAGAYKNETPIAFECVLYWCVKTIESTYDWGSYQENVVSSFANTSEAPFPWTTELLNDNSSVRTTYERPMDIFQEDINTREQVNFGAPNGTVMSTFFSFDEAIPAYVTANNSDSGQVMRVANNKMVGKIKSYPKNFWVQKEESIPHFVERMAQGLSDSIRISKSAELVYGTAYQLSVFVDVRWAWLAFPLFLLLLSLGFLVATIIQSARDRTDVGIWKTSAVAGLLYGLPGEMRQDIASSTKIGSPRQKAKELKVRWAPNQQGWRLSGSALSPRPFNTSSRSHNPNQSTRGH